MSDVPRRAAFLLGLGVLGAGPGVLGANLGAAAAALGPGYVWRFLTWGRRENEANDSYFPARAVPASPAPAPFPAAFDPARVELAFGQGPLDAFMAQTATTALVVVQDGRLVLEAYANGAGRETPLASRSMAKSVLAMLLGFAIAEGRIAGLDAALETLVPDAPGLRGSGVTLRHLVQMGGGLRFRGDHDPLGPFTVAPLWDGTRVAYFVPGLRDYLATARSGEPPGTRFSYDDRSAQLVGLVLARAFGTTLADALSTRLWTPMGAQFPAAWTLNSVADGLEKSESGITAAALDWAKLGQLVLDDRVLPPGWRAAMTAPIAPVPPGYYDDSVEVARYPGLSYGQLWWGFARPGGPTGAGADSFMHGLYGQVVYICRARRVVVVRTGRTEGGVPHWPALLRDVVGRL